MAGQNVDPEMQNLIHQVTERCLTALRHERAQSEQTQLEQINTLLEHWSEQSFQKTKDLVSSMTVKENQGQSRDGDAFADATTEIRERQSNLFAAVQESHSKQLDTLRAAIAEERKQFAQAQLAFEQTLKTRYECMVDALHEKVKAEQEARMQRAIDNLERSARIESERAKQAFEIQQEAELTLSQKFKGIVSDLRRSWEEEETGRAMQLEERLRAHYSVVLEHMEAQLKMALRLQDDADKQWLEDVEARNAQQVATLRAFEDKCKRLYDVRLTEYAEKTAQQMSQYEEQLLQAGAELAAEKAQFESRLRRIKLACSRWKVAYQKDVHERYQQMASVLEERYMSEVAERLQEVNDVKAALAEAQASLQRKEADIARIHKMYAPGGGGAAGENSTARMRDDLSQRWSELKTPLADRVECLSALLDCAPAAPEVVTRYEAIVEKLSARQPIAQLASRRQFIEYKLKLSSRIGTDGSSGTTGVSPADRAALIAELTEVSANLEALTRQYERRFNEPFAKVGTESPALNTPGQGAVVPPSPSVSAAGTVSWDAAPSPRVAGNGPTITTTSTSAASTPFASGAPPSARHSISLPPNGTNGTGAAFTQPSYMSPTATRGGPAATAAAAVGSGTSNSAAKSAFKAIPAAR